MKYPDDFMNQIINGDCLEVMKRVPDNCIDTIITDPPYKIGFMGKDWDKLDDKYREGEWIPCETCDGKGVVIEENIEMACPDCLGGGYELSPKKHNLMQKWHYNWAKEALRVAKPRSTLLCFGGTRTYHRLACAIEDAGWILKDCIMWLYGSGFPKATDISQILDKDECRKQLKEKLGRKPTQGEFKKEWEGFRKIIGDYQRPDGSNPRKKVIAKAIWNNADGDDQKRTAPVTPKATLWNGWKSHGLKPAYEPILVAMKPNEGSYANNALKWKVEGLNIDGGRIGFNSEADEKESKGKNQHSKYPNSIMRNPASHGIYHQDKRPAVDYTAKGRYPANVILDEEAGRMLDEQSGTLKSGKNKSKFPNMKNQWLGRSYYPEELNYGDTGGASRFFYCAKASKAERNRGCEGLENVKGETCRFRQDGSLDGKIPIKNNHHPTVKPLALMKYLCTLTKTPTGGIVFDPFCGSGSTLIACKELKRDCIGIDNNKEYYEIARKRINAVPELLF